MGKSLLITGALALTVVASAFAEPPVASNISSTAATRAEIEVASRAIGMIEKKVEAREPVVKRRIRALYRATRGASRERLLQTPTFDDQRLALEVTRLLRRDLFELGALVSELDTVRAALFELEAAPAPADAPAPALLRPIEGARVATGFGQRRRGRLRLVSRGLDLRAAEGAAVRAPLAGELVYRGAVRGMGRAVVIDAGAHWVVLGPINDGGPEVGARLTRGETLGTLAGDILHLELRRQDARGGVPIAPAFAP